MVKEKGKEEKEPSLSIAQLHQCSLSHLVLVPSWTSCQSVPGEMDTYPTPYLAEIYPLHMQQYKK